MKSLSAPSYWLFLRKSLVSVELSDSSPNNQPFDFISERTRSFIVLDNDSRATSGSIRIWDKFLTISIYELIS